MVWRKPPPIVTVDDLVRFVETRSKFVSQTTLYGYVKTRAGTRYVSLLEDDVFANSVNIAKWEIYLACVCDLGVHAAASVGAQGSLDGRETTALARHLVNAALDADPVPPERPQGFDDVRAAFDRRLADTRWHEPWRGDAPFDGSLEALVEWAPIADELKIHDVAIVKNSLRGKWRKVLEQFVAILVAGAVADDWKSRTLPAADDATLPQGTGAAPAD